MVKINSLSVALDRSDAEPYRSGDTVSGRCLISVVGELNLKNLEIKLLGSAEVHWTETETRTASAAVTPGKTTIGDDTTDAALQIETSEKKPKKEKKVKKEKPKKKDKTENSENSTSAATVGPTAATVEKKLETVTMTYSSEDQIIRLSYSPVDYEPQIIANGEHAIPFSFNLQSRSLPSSFEGKWGHVRYRVEAVVADDGLLENSVSSLPFAVSSPALASLDQLKPSATDSDEKRIGLLKCWSKEYIKFRASIDHIGQQTGIPVAVKCTVENKSGKTVKPSARLKQTISYRSRDKERHEETEFGAIDGSPIEPGKTGNESLVIPISESIPILHNQCPLISIKHLIVVELDVPVAYDLSVQLPIVVTDEDLPFNENNNENNNTKL